MVARRVVGLALGGFVFAACSSNGARSSQSPASESAMQGDVAGRASVASAGSDDAAPATAAGSSASSKPSGAAPDAGAGGSSAGRGAASMSTGHGGSGSAGTLGMSAAAGSAGRAGAAGASAPTGKLYSDDFESGSLTMPSWIDADPDLGGKWMIVAADGGKVLAQTASVSDWVIAAGGDYRWTDQVVEARVRITSEPGKAGIFARLSDTRNYYFLYIDGGSNLVLKKRVDNSSDDVQKMKVQTQANTWYTLKLSVIGDQIQGYLDGKMLVSGSDSSLTTGGIGVGTSDCTADFDDIVVNGS